MTIEEIKAIAESLLFASGAPLSLRRLAEVIGVAQAEVKLAIARLREEYTVPGRGIFLAEVAGGYQFRTVPEHADYVKTLIREKPNRLSRAALETLAIIAYRQPITKVEIEAVRGVDVDGVLNSLIARKLVRVMGRKDVPGRPWVYGTTPQFLELFGLADLASLPPLPDTHEPTVNPYDETTPGATLTENPEPSGRCLAPGSRDPDPRGAGTGEWGDGHTSGGDSGPTI
jgi:segregation and condensation protein B